MLRAIGGGNPRRLLDVAREFDGDYSQWSGYSAAAHERQQALMRLGRSAHMLWAELEVLGGASASDDRLLSRMGWTRARAVQVLGELEDAGLVTASSVKSGQGQPKKVYKVVSPTRFSHRRHGTPAHLRGLSNRPSQSQMTNEGRITDEARPW